MRHVHASAGCIVSVALLVGCSPYVYKQEVSKFDEGVTQAVAMFDGQREFMRNNASKLKRADLVAKGFPRLELKDTCFDVIGCLEKLASQPADARATTLLVNQKSAAGDVRESAGDDYPRLIQYAEQTCQLQTAGGDTVDIPAQAPFQRQVLAALGDYASALAGIVDAADRDALSQSAAKACGSAQALFVTAQGLQPASDSSGDAADKEVAQKKAEAERKARSDAQASAVSSVCGLISQVGITFLDQQRVNDADPIVQTLAEYMQGESRKILAMMFRASLIALKDTVGDTIGATCQNRYSSAWRTLIGRLELRSMNPRHSLRPQSPQYRNSNTPRNRRKTL